MSNQNTGSIKSSNIDIDKEVNILMKKNNGSNKSRYSMIDDLKNKFRDDDKVEIIMRKYNEKMKRVKKLSEKIKERLLAKYPNLSMKEYIEKITEYKKKYSFDDAETQAIINTIFLKKNPISSNEITDIYSNDMSKALGFVPASFNTGVDLSVKEDEVEVLQMILTLAGVTKELHNQITIQSLIYKDCESSAIPRPFDKTRINLFSYVHPVIAALFLPKFHLLDQHMLMASISGIIEMKSNGLDLQTNPDYELYWDICTDPAETVCINKPKPFTDLLNRCNVQLKLWEAVLNLRQGKYFTNDLSSFMVAIDACKATIFDSADLAYVKDEGTIMRKLLSAFSIRPTIIMTMPSYSMVPLTTTHISAISASHITTLSMITIRIPLVFNQKPVSININDGLEQQQAYIHHRQLVIKQQQILYSREILIFYVHRRYQTISAERLSNPYKMSSLPITLNTFEKLQEAEINFPPDDLPIGKQNNQNFSIKSVVTVQTSPIDIAPKSALINVVNAPTIIIGCTALIRCDTGKQFTNGESVFGYQYMPLTTQVDIHDNNKLKVMNELNRTMFMIEARKYGTLFIFRTDQNPSEIQ
jgi:hypothetical protein